MSIALEVVVHGRPAGTITSAGKAGAGRTRTATFRYRVDYLERYQPTPLSVSVSVPLKPGEHEIGAWLNGLLPDNPLVRRRWQREHDVASTDAVDLLASPIGRDCAGAVQFCRPDETAVMLGRRGGVRPLTNSEVAEIIERLERDESAWSSGHDDGAFSLAGAQSKLALRYQNREWSIPYGNAPTTHILKPSIRRFPDQHVIEHLSQRTATLLGIQAAHTECVHIGGQQALLVERYDRVRSPGGDYSRVHQEDMCQALRLEPDLKYQNIGGPGVGAIANVLRSHSSNPETDLRLFRDALLYNWLIVGTDAHAKNYGLLLSGATVRMAPLYDLCSILPYKSNIEETAPRSIPVGNLKMAMKIGRDYSVLKADYRAAWERTSRLLELPEPETLSRAKELATQLPEALELSVNELPHRIKQSPYVEMLREEINQRSKHCQHLHRMTKPTVQGIFNPNMIPEPISDTGAPTGDGSSRSSQELYI